MRIQKRSRHLPFGSTTRSVTIYSLKQCPDPLDTIVYCSDGQSIPAFAQEFFKGANRQDIWLVGVDCSPQDRNAEYVFGRDPQRFQIHEEFFTGTVLGWATQSIGIEHHRRQTAVFGYSCGGAFSVAMGIRHPDLFGTVLTFSIAGRPLTNFESSAEKDLSQSHFHLLAGTREPTSMRTYMKRLEKWLRNAGAQVDYQTQPGGHEFQLWSKGLNESI